MSISKPEPVAHPTRRQLLLGATAFGAGSLLAACGGGGGGGAEVVSPTPPTGGGTSTASFAEGPITGFGSIIVGGVRYDDSAASVTDDDGNAGTSSQLKLGAVVEIEGGKVDRPANALGKAVALKVVLRSSLQGVVNAVDTTNSTLTLLGQKVVVTSSTVFDDSITGGLAGIAVGNVVEVHALYDAVAVQFVATRIEKKTSVAEYRLRGVIGSLDTTAKTFKIGSETINYGSAPPLATPSALVNGAFVRVRLQTAQVAGAWVATRLAIGLRSLAPKGEAEVEGVITNFTSLAAFEVNGLKVSTSFSTLFPDGTAGVAVGARVEVKGDVVDGVLVAKSVELEDEGPSKPREYELHGTISNLDTTAKTFALRGLTIWYGGPAVQFSNGTAATLANGKAVETKGVLAADRLRIEARRIEFK
jgi:hypothetical protein